MVGDLELVVERCMQYFKRKASGVAYKPEQHFSNEVLLTAAMVDIRSQHDLLLLDDVIGRRHADFNDASRFDSAVDGVLLKGVRTRVDAQTAEEVLAALGTTLAEEGSTQAVQSWRDTDGALDAASLTSALLSCGGGVFTRAEVGEELLYGSRYGRIQTRVSHNVLLRWDVPGPRGGAGRLRVPYIAAISYFVRVPSIQLERGGVGAALRLAICSVSEVTEVVKEALFELPRQPTWHRRLYAVPVEVLADMSLKKVAMVRPPEGDERVVGTRVGAAHPEAGKTYFMPYVHVTERAD